MQIKKHHEIFARFAWKGADLEQSTDWMRRFSADELRLVYYDFEEKDQKRLLLLLLLWLAVPGSRPLPAGYELLFGSIEGGAVRGGVASKEGWRDVNEFRVRRCSVPV